MNRKLNTFFFLIAATLLNLIILAAIAAVLLLVFGLAYRNLDEVSTGLSWLAVLVIMFGSIAGTFILYTRLIKWIVKRWNLENYIEPVFSRGKRN